MPCHVIGQTHLETALPAYLFQYLVAGGIARHGENMPVPCHSLVLLYYPLRNVQQTDVRFGIRLLPSGDNP